MSQMDKMVAIVTGASRGLGRAIAKAYASEGASVVICARSQSPTGLAGTLEETARDIRSAGGDVLAIACDVTDESQVNEMVRQAMARYGKIDVLFNNAGAMVMGESILEIEPARWEQLMRVNVDGPYLCCRAVLPIMMGQQRGSIINMGIIYRSTNKPNLLRLYQMKSPPIDGGDSCICCSRPLDDVPYLLLREANTRTEYG